MLDQDITRLRAKWDQVDALVRELEQAGEDMTVARQALRETTALLDYAEVLDCASGVGGDPAAEAQQTAGVGFRARRTSYE